MKALSALLGLVVALVLVAGLKADADDATGKKVTLTGKLVCGKCTLSETDKCSNVLQVEKNGKTVNYYLKDKGKGATYHKGICAPNSSAMATVTGTLTTTDGKHYITPTKVNVKKE